MKKYFTILLILIGSLTFGQEINYTEIDNKANAIDSDLELIEIKFDLTNKQDPNDSHQTILRIWHKEKRIYKISQDVSVNYGKIKSEIYLNGKKPIKTIESENTYYYLPDSIAKLKGYSVDLEENYNATSYILDWDKKQRKVVISGKSTEEKKASFEWNKFNAIIRRAEKLVNN